MRVTINNEIWFRVLGFEKFYLISQFGRVKSLRKNRILNLKRQGKYLSISLFKDGKEYRKYVHTLVLENFAGSRPPGLQCRHLDGNPNNNCVLNLCWGTPKENQRDRILHGTGQAGKKRGPCKKTKAFCAEVLGHAYSRDA